MPVSKCEGCRYLEDSEDLEFILEIFKQCRISKSEEDGEFYVEHPEKDIAVKLSEMIKWHWEDFDAEDDADSKDNPEDKDEDKEDDEYYGMPF